MLLPRNAIVEEKQRRISNNLAKFRHEHHDRSVLIIRLLEMNVKVSTLKHEARWLQFHTVVRLVRAHLRHVRMQLVIAALKLAGARVNVERVKRERVQAFHRKVPLALRNIKSANEVVKFFDSSARLVVHAWNSLAELHEMRPKVVVLLLANLLPLLALLAAFVTAKFAVVLLLMLINPKRVDRFASRLLDWVHAVIPSVENRFVERNRHDVDVKGLNRHFLRPNDAPLQRYERRVLLDRREILHTRRNLQESPKPLHSRHCAIVLRVVLAVVAVEVSLDGKRIHCELTQAREVELQQSIGVEVPNVLLHKSILPAVRRTRIALQQKFFIEKLR